MTTRAHEATTVPRKPFSWKFFAIAAAIAGVVVLFAVTGADYDDLNERQGQLSQRLSDMLSQQQARLEQQEKRLEAQANQLVSQQNTINELTEEIQRVSVSDDIRLPKGALHVFFKKCPPGWEKIGELEVTHIGADLTSSRQSGEASTKPSEETVLCEQ